MYTEELFNIINNHFLFMNHKFVLDSIMKNEDVSRIFNSHLNFLEKSINSSHALKDFNQFDDFSVSINNESPPSKIRKDFNIKTSTDDSISIKSLSKFELSSKSYLNKYNNSLDIGFIIREKDEIINVLKIFFNYTNQEDSIINDISISLGVKEDNFVDLKIIKNHENKILSISINGYNIINDKSKTLDSFDHDIFKNNIVSNIFESPTDSLLKESILYGGFNQDTIDILSLTKDLSKLNNYVIDKKRTIFDMAEQHLKKPKHTKPFKS